MLCLTQIVGKELWKYVREKELKHDGFWKGLLLAYSIVGPITVVDWNGFFLFKK